MTSTLSSTSDHDKQKLLHDNQNENSRSIHKAFEDCKSFLYYLDSGRGYEACESYCVDGGAAFESQCETLADIKSVSHVPLYERRVIAAAFSLPHRVIQIL
jgi:hypothetical protein